MAKIYTKIGDVFVANLDDYTKKYFQYVANDLYQLNSSVIRVFKTQCAKNDPYVLSSIVRDEIDFYAHCNLNVGAKYGFWEKVGNISEIGATDILFCDTIDYGKPSVTKSDQWWVWKVGEDAKFVGKLEGENKEAEIGLIMNHERILKRMRTGDFGLNYPE